MNWFGYYDLSQIPLKFYMKINILFFPSSLSLPVPFSLPFLSILLYLPSLLHHFSIILISPSLPFVVFFFCSSSTIFILILPPSFSLVPFHILFLPSSLLSLSPSVLIAIPLSSPFLCLSLPLYSPFSPSPSLSVLLSFLISSPSPPINVSENLDG